MPVSSLTLPFENQKREVIAGSTNALNTSAILRMSICAHTHPWVHDAPFVSARGVGVIGPLIARQCTNHYLRGETPMKLLLSGAVWSAAVAILGMVAFAQTTPQTQTATTQQEQLEPKRRVLLWRKDRPR